MSQTKARKIPEIRPMCTKCRKHPPEMKKLPDGTVEIKQHCTECRASKPNDTLGLLVSCFV